MLARLLAPRTEAAFAFLRIVAGMMFGLHGVQKLFGLLTDKQPAFGSQVWVGGIVELVTGSLMMLGLFTVGAAFLASGQMVVAYVQFHWKLQLDTHFWPVVNKGELALLYSVLFLFVACRGAGQFSLDGLLARRRTPKG